MLRWVVRAVVGYLALLGVACVIFRDAIALHPVERGEIVASVWREGLIVEREIFAERAAAAALLPRAAERRGELVLETVVAEGPAPMTPELAFGLSFVPGRDGLRATLGEKTVYVTPDEILARQLYDHGIRVDAISVALGVDTDGLLGLVADKLATTAEHVRARATLRRIRVERTRSQKSPPRITPDRVTRPLVREAVIDGARYLARGVSAEGRFRYSVDAPTDRVLPDYGWPRHAGATFFLAQVGGLTGEAAIAEASVRAGSLMRGSALSSCGGAPCVGEDPVVDLGSSALALLAFTEIVERKIDASFTPMVSGLAKFLRSQQRADGEFMHRYDRNAGRPIDVQGLYYSSEATLALARAYGITRDPADLDAAVRGLAYLVGPAWSFFGDRYYFGEEHWTCQAMAALWPHAKNPAALDFCLRWQAYGRALQQREGDSMFDADGAIGVGPVVTPRLTPVASRCEAAVATLEVARGAGVDPEEIEVLDQQLRRGLALLLRQQFRPGNSHLFKNAAGVYGAMPGSEVDWELRIDYTQHMGSALVRWLETSKGPG